MRRIIVFPDGETFNEESGCTWHDIPDYFDIEETEEYLREDGEKYMCTGATFVSVWEGVAIRTPALVLPDNSVEAAAVEVDGLSGVVDEYVEIGSDVFSVEHIDGKYFISKLRQ